MACRDDDRVGLPPPVAPHAVRVATNVQQWERIAFLHWPMAPDAVRARLPDGLDVDVWDGMAWVGVTPFRIRVRPLGVPVVPPGATFPETNVRTYVTGPDVQHAIWFLHMEVTARWFVGALRTLGLPYVRRSMEVAEDAHSIRYTSRPSGSRRREDEIVVRPGRPLDPGTGGPLEQFLTARWSAYHRLGPVLLRTPVQHPPWRLRSATAERWEVAGVFTAAGLPQPTSEPYVHFCDGVDVRVGLPRPAGTPERPNPLDR